MAALEHTVHTAQEQQQADIVIALIPVIYPEKRLAEV
jgi:hypothetical protein